MEMSDLIIAVGYDIVEFAPSRWNKSGAHKIIHIDANENHINKLYQPDEEVIGDISYALRELESYCKPKAEPEWAFQIRSQIVAEEENYANDASFPMKPQKILHDIRSVLAENDILISESAWSKQAR